MRAHARIRIRCERVQCEHMRMRAFASHCMRTHFSCVMRAFAYVIWASSVSVMRAYARIHMRCERIRIACARIRIACARIACECAHLRGTYACPVLYKRFYGTCLWTNVYYTFRNSNQGLYLLRGRTSYCKITWSLEATRFGLRLLQLLWNLTGRCICQMS